ncbi:uncharacterized protein ATNIH1004_001277 [Aspergillus tanneri]|uniref:Major facilitator superfamily (MFS) profile domain-containing protein n=1 Tax=Aspergillus tanneri TaxID=1220188 RepID=A0A5M9N549_9EURO|nr:uncharacterized protein ATNIH1004_001277 [Aspergillus tanneri]KAA8652373.1 hypothetical protein ATNIH1004_001277 [Aspergillus tanneri]
MVPEFLDPPSSPQSPWPCLAIGFTDVAPSLRFRYMHGRISIGGAIIPLILRTLFSNTAGPGPFASIAFMSFATWADQTSIESILIISSLFLAGAVFSFEWMTLLGNVLPGFVTYLVVRLNILLSLVVVAQIIMAAVWLPLGSRDVAALYAVVAFFGFSSGGWFSLAPVCAGQLCHAEEYGLFYGTVYCVAAFGVLLIVPVVESNCSLRHHRCWSGFIHGVVELTCVALLRLALLNWNWKWKVKV